MKLCEEMLDGLKAGRMAERECWQGQKAVVLMQALTLDAFSSQSPGAKVNDRTSRFVGPDRALYVPPYFALWDRVSDDWIIGWAFTAEDILADDWILTKEKSDHGNRI